MISHLHLVQGALVSTALYDGHFLVYTGLWLLNSHYYGSHSSQSVNEIFSK